jgi:hypothetical protein
MPNGTAWYLIKWLKLWLYAPDGSKYAEINLMTRSCIMGVVRLRNCNVPPRLGTI